MKKYLALAMAGAMALAVLAATAPGSQAAQWQNNGQWQKNQNWKFKNNQNNYNWQGHNNNNWKGPPKKWSNNNNWNHNWNNNWKPKHQPHFNPAPFFFGFALGALTAPYWAEPVYAGYDPHVLWCLRNYPNTYNPRTNTYYIRPGVVAVCISPYSSPFPY